MKVRSFKIHSFQLPIQDQPSRKGFIIELQNDQGRIAYGEVSPLPGRSHESRQEALFSLFKLQEQFIHGTFTPFPLPASVAFGMESALRALNSPLQNPLSFPYTALSYGTDIETPCSQVKIKVSHLNFKETVSLITNFLKKGKRLIVDFNKTGTKEQILLLRQEFAPTDFDGLEDPVNNLQDLEELYATTSFPFHIDELFSPNGFIPSPSIATIVIKPSLIGNSSVIQKIKEYAIPLRLTSAFESEIGLLHIIRLADVLGIKTPLGIDTPSLFSKHLIQEPFRRQGETLFLDPNTYNHMPIDRTLLTSCHPSST